MSLIRAVIAVHCEEAVFTLQVKEVLQNEHHLLD